MKKILALLGVGIVVLMAAYVGYERSTPGGGMIIDVDNIDPQLQRIVAAQAALGAALANAMLARYPESKDRALTEKIRRQSGVVLRAGGTSEADFRITVLTDKNNAWVVSLPGGAIFVTEKLAHFLKDDADLVAVLGHEIGHVRGRALLYRMKKDPAALDWIKANEQQQTDDAALGRILDTILAVQYTADEEHTAELVAARILIETRSDPQWLEALPDLMRRAEASKMLAAHPASATRTAAIGEALREARQTQEMQLTRKAVELIIGKAGESESGRARSARQLGGQISVFAGGADRYYNFNVAVTREQDEAAAYLTSNGYILITEGWLKPLRDDVEISAALAHLVGHIEAHHGAKEMDELAQGSAKIGDNDPRPAQIAKMVMATRYSREQEIEADRRAAHLLMGRFIDPRAMQKAMEALAKASPAYAAVHPDPGNRAETIKAAIDQQFPKGIPAGYAR